MRTATKRLSIAAAALVLGLIVVIAGLAVAWPARADPDTDFMSQLHGYGIYRQLDYNAWIGRITCKRSYSGVDADANLQRGATTMGAWDDSGAESPRLRGEIETCCSSR